MKVHIKVLPLIVSLLLWPGCQRKTDFSRLAGSKKHNIILVSVDTLRADRVGCYGFAGVETPTIDEMAGRGVRFTNCIAQTPLTLPSHTTMLTGTYPFFHGVRDNGGFLVPQDLITLAELFKENGYETAAVVGAYVLDSKWGLNQGFDFYYDRFELEREEGFSVSEVQRPAEEVISQTLDWLDGIKKKNFFLFVHLYDPHSPYDPPSPFREKYSHDLYLGEIAYTDSQLHRLWEYMEKEGLLEDTILVFCSDHGESLGEHGEATHGFFVYQEGIHVPLIFVFPWEELQGLTRTQTVSLTDIMPTILEMVHIPVPDQVQGRSLVPFFFREGASKSFSAYSETYYPRFHYGWSDIKSIQDGRYKLILSPQMELYDLEEDPEETADLSSKKIQVARGLEKELNRCVEEYSRGQFQTDYRKVDEETRERLAALGYVGTFVDSQKLEGKTLPSPREKIHVFNKISLARESSLKGELEKAKDIIVEVIQKDPEIIDAYFVLGNISFKEHNYPEAIRWFSEALERKPDYDFAALNIAVSYIEMDELGKAEKTLADYIQRFPADSVLYRTLGDINLKQEDYPEAIRYFEECLRVNPRSAKAHNGLARVYLILDETDKALRHALRAKELNPKIRNLHYNLAQIYEAKGRTQEALFEYQAELRHFPDNFSASFNLALLYRGMKDRINEEEYLQKTISLNPEFPLGYLFLGELYYLQEGRDRQAISLLEQAVSLGLDKKHLKLAYYYLAKIYLRMGNQALASRYALKIKKLQ
ncbi:MAG: sulfatase-like hydrolase/transferase [Candidatus Aminicenantales bacterium]